MNKKVVINTCFGGFGLSNKAFEMYLDRMNIAYIKESHPDSIWSTRYRKADHSDEEYLDFFDMKRDDPILISVIEEIGCEEASGDMSELCIIELPDDVDCWVINNYDGVESVHECHRSWTSWSNDS